MDDLTGMSAAQAYKFGFLLRCADEGLTPDETLGRVKAARATKEALWGLPIGAAAGSLIGAGGRVAQTIPSLLSYGTILGLGAPIVGGAGAGYLAAKATAPGREDVESAKQDEIEGEYYRLAEEARRNAARKRISTLTGRKVKLVGPAAA